MNKKLSLTISVLLLLMLAALPSINAQDDTPELDDNACYAGGSLAGECFSEQDWVCGWHVANQEAAIAAGEAYGVPAECSYIAPLAPAQPGTSQENACFEGGAMEGKCDTDWEWECGWYLARWQEAGGWNGDYDMPSWCESVLPGQPQATGSSSGALVCVTDNMPNIHYGDVIGQRCANNDSGFDDYFSDGEHDYFYMFGNFGSCPPAPSGFSFYSGPDEMFMEVEPGLILPVNNFAQEPFNNPGPHICTYQNNNLPD